MCFIEKMMNNINKCTQKIPKIIPTKFIHTKRKNYEKKLMATVCVFDDVATTMKFNVNYEKLIYLYEF